MTFFWARYGFLERSSGPGVAPADVLPGPGMTFQVMCGSSSRYSWPGVVPYDVIPGQVWVPMTLFRVLIISFRVRGGSLDVLPSQVWFPMTLFQVRRGSSCHSGPGVAPYDLIKGQVWFFVTLLGARYGLLWPYSGQVQFLMTLFWARCGSRWPSSRPQSDPYDTIPSHVGSP